MTRLLGQQPGSRMQAHMTCVWSHRNESVEPEMGIAELADVQDYYCMYCAV